MNIIVKNRATIDAGYHPGGKAILISIADPDKNHPKHNELYHNVLWLKFDDADVSKNGNVVIGLHDGIKIYKFATRYDDLDAIVVNCEAGMSRSAGVAVALSRILNGDDSQMVREKPLFNRMVYRTVMEAYHHTVDPYSVIVMPPDECPDCGSELVDGNSWSGIKCSNKKCDYWFCF